MKEKSKRLEINNLFDKDFEVKNDYNDYELSEKDKRDIEKAKKTMEKDDRLTRMGKYNNNKIIKSKLVLWDIENVNFYNDISIIDKIINDKNALKISVFKEASDYDNRNRLSNESINHKMKKRNWNIEKTKKIADDFLINYYYSHKKNIKELILITADKDFAKIVKDAISSDINVLILNNNNEKHWCNDFHYKYIN